MQYRLIVGFQRIFGQKGAFVLLFTYLNTKYTVYVISWVLLNQ